MTIRQDAATKNINRAINLEHRAAGAYRRALLVANTSLRRGRASVEQDLLNLVNKAYAQVAAARALLDAVRAAGRPDARYVNDYNACVALLGEADALRNSYLDTIPLDPRLAAIRDQLDATA